MKYMIEKPALGIRPNARRGRSRRLGVDRHNLAFESYLGAERGPFVLQTGALCEQITAPIRSLRQVDYAALNGITSAPMRSLSR